MEKFIGSFNEWDNLEEVIVGIAQNARRPELGIDQMAVEYSDCINKEAIYTWELPEKIIKEANEDLEKFCSVLKDLGIKVHRPKEIDHSKKISTFDWETDTFYNFCPRDSILVVGDKIIETPMTMRSRFVEQLAYKDILIKSFKDWAKWISAPKPRLLDNTYNKQTGSLALNNFEPIFDAANVLRAGKDLFYLVSDTWNHMWAEWLQSILGEEYRVNICESMYSGVHIDSTMAFLRPWLVLLNPERITEDNLPEPLKKWEKIWCPNLVDTNKSGFHSLSSIWVGMNLFMINPNLAIVDKEQVELIKSLEKHEIKIIPLSMRHSRVMWGWFHCITLDLKRRGTGNIENYF